MIIYQFLLNQLTNSKTKKTCQFQYCKISFKLQKIQIYQIVCNCQNYQTNNKQYFQLKEQQVSSTKVMKPVRSSSQKSLANSVNSNRVSECIQVFIRLRPLLRHQEDEEAWDINKKTQQIYSLIDQKSSLVTNNEITENMSLKDRKRLIEAGNNSIFFPFVCSNRKTNFTKRNKNQFQILFRLFIYLQKTFMIQINTSNRLYRQVLSLYYVYPF
ncbi:hypothetical protein TTHERM_00185380 (macronuclear) [Tetrahymena thermophila SB210]|uniref:Uncharacterized protein n=1 Tax=Tetrahymena thermophila (strain SB210) TaxID=312017 RepID=Q22T74_TETTS|nr:hypothetical protein TTHERM_00185380 [Tetrahymena thermophila SB210]EAR88564.2 hypothetical protein TTHERM_00185380 [Tetrahymena thermophila SB210]|eukprot:XP_001008809.2 hypothetical protein TTHERM_00185380 [Tetrahymena thermophila SB210]